MKTLFAQRKLTPTVILGVEDLEPLSPVVHPDNHEDIKRSMLQKGMNYPIVVWYTQVGEWIGLANLDTTGEFLYPDETFAPEDYVYLVMCGCNRLQIAVDLGYESIECIVCDTRKEVSEWAGIMRKQWRLEKLQTVATLDHQQIASGSGRSLGL